jgi:hypothetical protein
LWIREFYSPEFELLASAMLGIFDDMRCRAYARWMLCSTAHQFGEVGFGISSQSALVYFELLHDVNVRPGDLGCTFGFLSSAVNDFRNLCMCAVDHTGMEEESILWISDSSLQ